MTSQSPPPPPPVDKGYHAGDRLDVYPLASVGTLLGITSITTALRIYWRARPSWRIAADDYTLVFALVGTLYFSLEYEQPTNHHGRPSPSPGMESTRPCTLEAGDLKASSRTLGLWGR